MRKPSLACVCASVALCLPRRPVTGDFAGMGGRRCGVPGILRRVLSIVRKAEGCEGPGAGRGAEGALTPVYR